MPERILFAGHIAALNADCYAPVNRSRNGKTEPVLPGVWRIVANPPPCGVGDPTKVLARCERLRQGSRCRCDFDLAVIGGELKRLGLGRFVGPLMMSLTPTIF